MDVGGRQCTSCSNLRISSAKHHDPHASPCHRRWAWIVWWGAKHTSNGSDTPCFLDGISKHFGTSDVSWYLSVPKVLGFLPILTTGHPDSAAASVGSWTASTKPTPSRLLALRCRAKTGAFSRIDGKKIIRTLVGRVTAFKSTSWTNPPWRVVASLSKQGNAKTKLGVVTIFWNLCLRDAKFILHVHIHKMLVIWNRRYPTRINWVFAAVQYKLIHLWCCEQASTPGPKTLGTPLLRWNESGCFMEMSVGNLKMYNSFNLQFHHIYHINFGLEVPPKCGLYVHVVFHFTTVHHSRFPGAKVTWLRARDAHLGLQLWRDTTRGHRRGGQMTCPVVNQMVKQTEDEFHRFSGLCLIFVLCLFRSPFFCLWNTSLQDNASRCFKVFDKKVRVFISCIASFCNICISHVVELTRGRPSHAHLWLSGGLHLFASGSCVEISSINEPGISDVFMQKVF